MVGSSGATRAAPNVAVPLHALFEAVSDGVMITDAVGSRTYGNQALHDLIGVDPASDHHSSRAPEWLPERFRGQYHDVIGRTARSKPGDDILVLEWAVVDAAGVERAVVARLFPVRGANGGDSSAVLWLLQTVEIRSDVPNEWRAAVERIAAELHRLGVGASPSAAALSHSYEGADRLTRRERDVVKCLLEGERVVSIAERLDLSPHTVRNHLKSIFRKLDVHSQAELVRHVRG